MILKVGQAFASTVDSTTVIVLRAPADEVAALTCGGFDMAPGKEGQGDGVTIDAVNRGGALLGKRYVDEHTDLEVLCTKPGIGVLAVDGRPLQIKSAKPLPASD